MPDNITRLHINDAACSSLAFCQSVPLPRDVIVDPRDSSLFHLFY